MTTHLNSDALRVSGCHPLRGRIQIPGDKGITHRALIASAFAEGESVIKGCATGQDVIHTRSVLQELGVEIQSSGLQSISINGQGVQSFSPSQSVLDCGNSGTTLRMMTGVLAASTFNSELTGDASLRSRPMGRVVDPLRLMGANIEYGEVAGNAPLLVEGSVLEGSAIEISVSSGQVKSACLFAGLQAQGVTEINEPAPSRDHTERLLEALGAPIERVSETCIRIKSGSIKPFELNVPGDASSAAFLIVAALITPGSLVTIEEMGLNPLRIRYIELLKNMGAQIVVDKTDERLGEPIGSVRVESSQLKGCIIEASEGIIDEIPILAVAAAFAQGETEFRQVAELKVKESDRISTLTQELGRLGVEVESGEDSLIINGGQPQPGQVSSHGDHRLALSLAVAANALTGDTVIEGWSAADVSYPDFVVDLDRLTAGQ